MEASHNLFTFYMKMFRVSLNFDFCRVCIAFGGCVADCVHAGDKVERMYAYHVAGQNVGDGACNNLLARE